MKEELKAVAELPSLAEETQKTLDALDLGPEDAGAAEFAMILAEAIDDSQSTTRPISRQDIENASKSARELLIRRIRTLELRAGRYSVLEKVAPTYLTTMRELGGTPGARKQAEAPVAQEVDHGDELDDLRAARRMRGA